MLKSFKTWSIFYFNQSKMRPFPFTEANSTYAQLSRASLKFYMESRHCIFKTAQQKCLLGL